LVAGLLVGAGAGWAIAVPTVHHIENSPRTDDGPFQQIDYLIFPVVGAVIAGPIGWTVGYSGSQTWVVQFHATR
jgi:hypothetical protein